MGTIGRKNVHGKGGVRFKAGYTYDKRKNMLRNVDETLIISGKTDESLEETDAGALSAKILDEHFKVFEHLNDA